MWIRKSLLLLGTILATQAGAQFYYQDVLQVAKTSAQFAQLKQHNVRQITASSFDADGSPSANFVLFQQVNAAQQTLTTTSKSDYTNSSVLTSYYDASNRLIKTIDESGTLRSETQYQYNEQGQLLLMSILTNDSLQQFSVTETHLYSYDSKGMPTTMLRIKNNSDTTKVIFIADETTGKPGEEQWWKGNRKIETWFYYYNEQQQLTDIARPNKKAGRILPDLIFEYDAVGRISQQTSVQSGSNMYRIWRYVYDARGLKLKEGVFNKYKEPEGRIEYSYQ